MWMIGFNTKTFAVKAREASIKAITINLTLMRSPD